MKLQKSILIVFFMVVLGVILGLNLQAKAGPNYIQPTPSQNVIQYLGSRYGRLNIPFTKIQIIQESPLQIEVDIQSLSDGKKWMPEDFENLYLARREAILAMEQGYNIERYTEVLLNQQEESVSWARIKINGEISYTRLSPSSLTDALTGNLVNEKIGKLNRDGMTVINQEISSSDGFQTLKLYFSTGSLEEANRALSETRKSLRPLAKDINSQGAQVVMIQLEVKNEKGELLLNYLLDLQFNTEGWWAANGIDTESWFPSRPAPVP